MRSCSMLYERRNQDYFHIPIKNFNDLMVDKFVLKLIINLFSRIDIISERRWPGSHSRREEGGRYVYYVICACVA